MKVKEIMVQPLIVVYPHTPLEAVARTMLEHRIGCVPVVDSQGQIEGIVTESDFAAKEKGLPFTTFSAPQVLGQWLTSDGIEQIYAAARTMTARDIMSPHVITVTEEDSVNEAVELMLRYDINRIPVVRDGVAVGIVARHDLLKLVAPS